MPSIVRIVDRGSLFNPTVDIGGMELYAANVIATDPYHLIKTLRASFESAD